jgi:hypothetical protein
MVENHFKKNRDIFGFESIAQLIEEVMDSMNALGIDPALLREVDEGGGSTPERDTFDWNAIPEIGISELGWTDTRTHDSGGVPTGQRQVLMNYLERIATGKDLKTKITELNAFMESPPVASGEGAAQVVADVMSYLVFFKTLTRVITNFNASSAGFSFESFIAVLMGGTQIKTGSQTIADYKTEEGPVSLKLYSEEGVEIGGSWQDLVDDLADSANDYQMTYLVVLKNLEGEGLEQNGTLTFYQFALTLQNIANFVLASRNKDIIALPLDENGQLVKTAAGARTEETPGEEPQTLAEAVGRPRVTAEELEEKRQELLAAVFKDAFQIPEVKAIPDLEKLLKQDTFAFGGPVFKKVTGTFPASHVLKALMELYKDNPEVYAFDPPGEHHRTKKAKAKGIHSGLLTDRIKPAGWKTETSVGGYIATLITKAATGAVQELRKGPEAARVAAGQELGKYFKASLEDVAASVKYYNSLPDDAARIEALHSSYGYLEVKKFSMGKGVLTKGAPAQTGGTAVEPQPLGALKIGAMNILPILQQARGELNNQVYSIFTHLKTLSVNLNAYFAAGLDDEKSDPKGAGQKAKEAADAIATATKEAIDQQPTSKEGP